MSAWSPWSPWSPWSLGRRAAAGRRGLVLFVLAALLYALAMHAARACQPLVQAAFDESATIASPCHHGQDEANAAQAACEAHCRADAQPSRDTLSVDLPEAALAPFAQPAAPVPALPTTAAQASPPARDCGPPLHLLLHRLLR